MICQEWNTQSMQFYGEYLQKILYKGYYIGLPSFCSFYLFICVAVLGLCCDTKGNLVAALVAACKLLVVAYGIQFPDQGSTLSPLKSKCRVLAPGPPGKAQFLLSFFFLVPAFLTVILKCANQMESKKMKACHKNR